MAKAFFLSIALLISQTAPGAAPVRAQDAEFGCKVLLCAASSNPSWHGVPYCVPPMEDLIAQMAEPGFHWPICHQANTGAPGHETFEECPAGYHPGTSNADGNSRNGEQDACVKQVNSCGRNGRTAGWSYDGDGCVQTISIPRPRRADPYYFDIPNNQGVKQRFWFNLDH